MRGGEEGGEGGEERGGELTLTPGVSSSSSRSTLSSMTSSSSGADLTAAREPSAAPGGEGGACSYSLFRPPTSLTFPLHRTNSPLNTPTPTPST